MPTPPYAKVLVSVAGGAATSGGVVALNGQTVQLSPESTVGWDRCRWELYSYPSGFGAPSGWSTDAAGNYFSTAFTPPVITWPATTATWGKLLPRLLINDAVTNSKALASLRDESTGVRVASPNGLRGTTVYETNQFQTSWVVDHMADLKTIEGFTGGGGASTTAVADLAALRAVSTPTAGQTFNVLSPPSGPWVYSSTTGANFADDGATLIKPTSVALASNGRWYSTAAAPVVATIAQLRLAVSGQQASISVQAYSALGDGGGGVFDYDSTDTTSADDSGTVIVAGTLRYKRRYQGDLKIQYFGVSSTDVGPAFNRLFASAAFLSGGTIDASGLNGSYAMTTAVTTTKSHHVRWGAIVLTCSAAWTFNGANVEWRGSAHGSTVIAPNSAELFIFKGTYGGYGQGMIRFDGFKFGGGTGTSKLFDMSIARTPALLFGEHTIEFDCCHVADFTGAYAITFGTSTYYCHFYGCTFANNYGCVVFGQQSDAWMYDTKILYAAPGATHQLVCNGPTINLINGEAFASAASNQHNYYDILFAPTTSTIYGGNTKIMGWKFGSEAGNLDPRRARIGVAYNNAGDTRNISANVEIAHNYFYGTSPCLARMTRTGTTVTCNLFEFNGTTPVTHGCASGQVLQVCVSQAPATLVDFVVTATASGTSTLTWTSATSGGTISADGVLTPAGEVMIDLQNPVTSWNIHDNIGSFGGVLVNDAYALAGADTGVQSGARDNSTHNTYRNNSLSAPYNAPARPFTNGGRCFDIIDAGPHEGDLQTVGYTRVRAEAPILQNRIKYSEDMSNALWAKDTGVTVTASGSDWKVARSGSWAPNIQCFSQGLDTTALRADGCIIRVLAKASGTAKQFMLACVNNPASTFDAQALCNLTSDLQWFELPVRGWDPAVNHAVFIYPGGRADIGAAEMIISKVQVCDYASCGYVKSVASYVSDASSASWSQKKTTHAGGLVVGDVGSPTVTSGTGSPEAAVTAPVGSTYFQSDAVGGGLWSKVDGTGNTGWGQQATMGTCLNIAMPDATYGLTAAQCRTGVIRMTGTLTAARAVTTPASWPSGRPLVVFNDTTGGFSLAIQKLGGGTAYTLGNAASALIMLDDLTAMRKVG